MTQGHATPAVADILGISGSLRTRSHNTSLLRAAYRLAGPGERVELWNGLETIPPFNEDHEHDPGPAVGAMRERVTRCDAVLIATPEYNTSIPGQLKNALDWLSRPTGRGVLAGKPVAVISASPSAYGARWSQETVHRVLDACGATVIGDPLCVAHCDRVFTAEGTLHDPAHRFALGRLLTQLGEAARSRDKVELT
ncbi:NADPH-dependent FMN reductase [Amycolatopsis sp. NPDC059021]|uniref:NADPH-dependent FMN reductase n=1 Tax=Amycolatopsis sp. NPDC059021 TaxID=3346704 RepID=UPI00366F8179